MEKLNINNFNKRFSQCLLIYKYILSKLERHFFSNLVICITLFVSYTPQQSYAHGGVFLEEDVCVIEVGFFRAHFTIYQPQLSRHEEICEDIPSEGETLFVMEYLHDGLRDMLVDFRIIKDTQKLGRFAKLEDIEKINDIHLQTVFYQPATINQDGVYLAQHDLSHEGYYIGVVNAENPEDGATYSAVFPFQVGGSTWGYIPAIIALAIFLQLNYWLMSGGYQRIQKMIKK